MAKYLWQQLWTGEQPLFKQYAQIERFIRCRRVIGNVATQALIFAEDAIVRAFFTDKSYQQIYNDSRKLFDNKVATKTIADIEASICNFWKLSKLIRNHFLGIKKFETLDLAVLLKEWSERMVELFAYFLTTGETVTHELENYLAKSVNSQDELLTLIAPSRPDLIFEEKRSWLNVLSDSTEDRIYKHMLAFPFLFSNIDSVTDAYRLMKNRLEEISAEKLQGEIDETIQKFKKTKEEKRKILLHYENKNIRHIAKVLENFALLRLEIKNCWAGIHYYLFPMFQNISDNSGLSVREVMMFLTAEEIVKFFKTGETPTHNEIEKRKKCYLIAIINGKMIFKTGEAAINLKDRYFYEFNAITSEIRGTIANKGVIDGVVKVVRIDDLRLIQKIADSIKEPVVLVTGMTNPNMIPLIRKVKAIITDEGGLTCHAAIISREFNVPCIVGTKIATQVLHDGDLVEVDADKGVVKILKRK